MRYICLILGLLIEGHLISFAQKKWTANDVINKSELIPISVTGDKDNRINIVIMNKWESKDENPYNKKELREEFINDIENSLIAAMTYGDSRAKTAFAHYKEFFNIYGLWCPDFPEWNKGIDMKVVDEVINKMFLPWKDDNTGWATMLAMPNSSNGGGGAGRNLEKRVGSANIAGNEIAKMLHEISHTALSLGDEYTTNMSGFSASPTYNSSIENRRHRIKWRAFIDDSTPVPTPYTLEYKNVTGAFEGCQYRVVGYYRPSSQKCLMGAGVFGADVMCPICNQRVVMRIYNLVNPINKYTPSDLDLSIESGESRTFSIDHIVPTPNTQIVRWYLNDKLINVGLDKIDIDFGNLPNYTVKCVLTDESPYVRQDPPYGDYPKRTIVWKVRNKSILTDNAPISVRIINNAGQLKAEVEGGIKPYFIKWSTGDTSNVINPKRTGMYDVTVHDSKYRITKDTMMLFDNNKYKTVLESQKNNPELASKVVEKLFDNFGNRVIYEAEKAMTSIENKSLEKHWMANNDTYVNFNGNKGIIKWNVKVARSGFYPIDFVYASSDKECNCNFIVNGKTVLTKSLDVTRPMYTGWEMFTFDTYLTTGDNTIEIQSISNPLPNIDYIRIPDSYIGIQDLTLSDKEIYKTANNITIKMPDKLVELLKSNLVMRFDASDLNADGQVDKVIPERGPVKNWTGYTKQGAMDVMAKYEPISLNNRGVCSFETVWKIPFKYKVQGFQSVLIVYKESEMSQIGISPINALNPYLAYNGKSSILSNQNANENAKKSDYYLNGKKINPFVTANPMDFSMLFINMKEKDESPCSFIEGFWEGQIAEIMLFDRALTDSERVELESYIKSKWFGNN